MMAWHSQAWRPVYRVRQFLQALLAFLAPPGAEEMAVVRGYLPEAAWSLFLGMARGDQRHSLNVLQSLRSQSVVISQPLAQAALLHDCAKHGGGVRLWHRVAVVLLAACAPATLARWRTAAAPARTDWRYPFWAHLHHPERGAELAAAAGCHPMAVLLIAHHQDRVPDIGGRPELGAWLAALQRADDDN